MDDGMNILDSISGRAWRRCVLVGWLVVYWLLLHLRPAPRCCCSLHFATPNPHSAG